MSAGANKENIHSFSNYWFMLLALVTSIASLLVIYVYVMATPEDLSSAIEQERTSNASVSVVLDNQSWSNTKEFHLFQDITKKIIPPTDYQNTTDQNLFHNAAKNLVLYGMLIDYRLSVVWVLIPYFLVIVLAIIIDGFSMRERSKYRSGFSSPLQHSIGTQVLTLPSIYVFFILIFLPFAVPVYWIAALLSVKMVGVWLFVRSLPKRI